MKKNKRMVEYSKINKNKNNISLIDLMKEHALMILLMAFVTAVFFWPSLQGKVHKEMDMVQGKSSSTEILKYNKKHIGWTNSIFGGMPSTLIKGKPNGNKIVKINYLTLINSWAKYPIKILFMNLLGLYILLITFKIKPPLAVAGAIAYGLATFSISSIEAAHYTKVLAMGMMPAVLAGLVLIFNRKYWFGFAFLAFNVALQTYYFHYQITYYTILVLLTFSVFYAINQFKNKDYKGLVIAGTIVILAGLLGGATEYNRMQDVRAYKEHTMRGGKEDLTGKAGAKKSTGLERDYAFAWSYGIFETLTGVIPNMQGGSSSQKIAEDSKFVKTLVENRIPESSAIGVTNQPLPTYWGALPFTGAPIYFGAIIIFLFILGLITYKGKYKWAIIATTILSFALSWGKNLSFINNFLFDNLPLYGNFRTPMMIQSIAQMTIVLLAILGVDSWLKLNKKDRENTLKKAGLIAGGIVAVFGILFLPFYEFTGLNDVKLYQQISKDPMVQGAFKKAMIAQRSSMVFSDALRSLLFMGLGFGVLWFYLKGTIKKLNHVYLLLGAFILFDLGGIAKRYLPWSAFDKEADEKEVAVMSNADKEILKDKDLYYRVFDLSTNPFNDNSGANFHKMIGGYHPAKLSRYQDLISEHLAKQNPKVLDMLNTKYLIVRDRKTGQVRNVPRTTNMGNAWFVDSVKFVNTAKEEIDFLKDFNPKTEAVANVSFKKYLIQVNDVDSSDAIVLNSYHPDKLEYTSTSKNGGVVVFSDIYLKDKNGWYVYVDGIKTNMSRVNYVLRAINVPSGTHKITFTFENRANMKFPLSLVSSVLILLLLAGSIIYSIRNYKFKNENA